MKRTNFYCLLFIVCFITACEQNNPTKTFAVSGTFKHAPTTKIFLAELPFGSTHRTILDSASLDTAGKFSLKTIAKGEGIYQLFIENGPGIMLINDAEKISIQADANHLSHYTIDGGTANQDLQKMFGDYLAADSLLQHSKAALDTLEKKQMKAAEKDSLVKLAKFEVDNRITKLTTITSNFVHTEANGTAVYFALGMSKKLTPEPDWNKLLQSSLTKFPHHPGLMLLNVSANSGNSLDKQGLELVGKPVPSITLPDTSGKNVSVASFKGKWLLIDFWASWCAPCRQENPNVLKAFKQFNAKNFTILGISLDEKKENWLNAIHQDGLAWTQISDLQMWKSQAVTVYNFNGIPFNILVDPNGVVNSVNLRGDSLINKLAVVLKP
jgi:peroxiredoxin